MTAELWLRDLLVYGLQSAVLIGLGAALTRLLGLRSPDAMLTFWRALLAACLMLPFCQAWREAVPSSRAPALPARVEMFAPAGSMAPAKTDDVRAWPLEAAALLLVGAGIVARGLWLARGGVGLRRLRATATPLVPLPAAVRAAQERVGVAAEVRVSDRVTGPVTFGARRPIIVVPPDVLRLDDDVQEAIACHELVHVRRGDWIDAVLEEVVRTLFWFHPGVRWLIGRIQLSREQVVDRSVIELTRSRDRYVDALMAVALTKSRIALVPAPLFLRRRLLKTRIASLFQEQTMSTRRLIVSLAATAAALVVAAATSVRLFPLQASGQPATDRPVSIVSGGDGLLHGTVPEYPRRAIQRSVEGDVLVEMTVDDQGHVADARVISGAEDLRRAVLASVLEWHFAPGTVKSTTHATLRFSLAAAAATEPRRHLAESHEKAEGHQSPAQRNERLLMEIERALQDPNLPGERRDELKMKLAAASAELETARRKMAAGGDVSPFAGNQVLTQIRSEGIGNDARANIVARLGVHVGDRLTEDAAKRIAMSAAAIDEHLRVVFRGDGQGGIVMTIVPR